MDQQNLTSLLKNVNFFKAEKHLLKQKGLKFNHTMPKNHKNIMNHLPYDYQSLKPISFEDTVSSTGFVSMREEL